MVNILFTWAKENSDISYKQGMNELLAIVLFVAYAEQAPSDMSSSKTQEYLSVLNDPRHIEADVFWLFERLMDLGVAELFNPMISQRPAKKKNDLFTWEAEKSHNDLVNQDKSASDNVSSVLKRCHKIHHRILQGVDKELYLYLEKQKIEPQMYLQRYLRCILSREFNLADTLILWDSIFAKVNQAGDNADLALLDFICVAMIIFVRAFSKIYIVLQSDYSGILRRLLKFPPVEDVHILVNMALSYQERMQGKDLRPVFLASESSKPPQKTEVKPIFTGASATPSFPQAKPAGLITPSQVLSSSGKLPSNPLSTPSNPLSTPSNPLSTPSGTSTTPTSSKGPFGFGPIKEGPSSQTISNPLSLQPSNPSPPSKTSADTSSSRRPGIFDPLQIKESKVENKFVNPAFKASSPSRSTASENKTEVKNEESKEEKKVLARSENSFVEKCNTALLLLLEQSDE
jgi:hypothetical protein